MKKSILYGNDFRCSAKSFIAAMFSRPNEGGRWVDGWLNPQHPVSETLLGTTNFSSQQFIPNPKRRKLRMNIGIQIVYPDINDREPVDRILIVDSKLGATDPCFIKHQLLVNESRE